MDIRIQTLFEILILFLEYTPRSPTDRLEDSSIFEVFEKSGGGGSIYFDPDTGRTVKI